VNLSSALRFAALAAAVAAVMPAASGFQVADTTLHAAHLRVDSTLALIPVHVATAAGSSVTDLSKENFRILEDNVEQRISYFATEDAPVSVGLLFDTSGSMRAKMHQSAEAAQAFFQTANSEDEFFLVEFNDRPKLSIGFTPDSSEVSRQISRMKPTGRTSLLDAIHLALVQMKRARNPRKALVILSDGGDNHSRKTATEIRRDVKESEVEIYAMGIFDSEDMGKLPIEERNGPHLLDELAAATGGTHFPVERLSDLAGIAAQIGNQLRSEYVLGYSPISEAHDGKYHRVTVDLEPPAGKPSLRVFYRHGYYQPGD
jgi:Ca-activated chloride channel family protein